MITDEERAHRREEVEAARHSAGLEGLQVTKATATDQDAYVDGQIDLDEVSRRVRARYGVV